MHTASLESTYMQHLIARWQWRITLIALGTFWRALHVEDKSVPKGITAFSRVTLGLAPFTACSDPHTASAMSRMSCCATLSCRCEGQSSPSAL